MRTAALVTVLPFLATALATPFHIPTGPSDLAAQAIHSVQDWFSGAVSEASDKFEKWEKDTSVVKAENVITNGIECEFATELGCIGIFVDAAQISP